MGIILPKTKVFSSVFMVFHSFSILSIAKQHSRILKNARNAGFAERNAPNCCSDFISKPIFPFYPNNYNTKFQVSELSLIKNLQTIYHI